MRLSGSWALAATAPSPIPSQSLPDASISTRAAVVLECGRRPGEDDLRVREAPVGHDLVAEHLVEPRRTRSRSIGVARRADVDERVGREVDVDGDAVEPRLVLGPDDRHGRAGEQRGVGLAAGVDADPSKTLGHEHRAVRREIEVPWDRQVLLNDGGGRNGMGGTRRGRWTDDDDDHDGEQRADETGCHEERVPPARWVRIRDHRTPCPRTLGGAIRPVEAPDDGPAARLWWCPQGDSNP